LLSNKGIIIKTFREFLDAKELVQEFAEPFSHYLAYVDVFTAISSWLRETNTHQNKTYCSYLYNQSTPSVKGTNIWNICCDQPIYNDITLGIALNPPSDSTSDIISDEIPVILEDAKIDTSAEDDNTDKQKEITEEDNEKDKKNNIPEENNSIVQNETPVILEDDTNKPSDEKQHITIHNNTIITGPNGAGKSTYIKAVIECIILGQTVGVVPASEFIITPFANITTYLNIPDCQGKESLFQAEMSRCYQQLQMLEKAEQHNEFSFNIMDEIFVSTNYQEGMSGAYAIINQLCKFRNCLNIITTHFDVLANMNELPVNKHYFDIEVDASDNISKDYKLKAGVSKKHMALKLLKKKGFSAEIIKDAEYLYEKINKK
jgi:hypothetical protein